MDKRLIKLLNRITPPQETCMLDTYNQAIHTDCSCTIRRNINTANHHFIMECKFFQYPRGANKGGILNTEICPTISTSSWENNCLLIEMENIEIIQVGNIVNDADINFKNPQRGRIYSVKGISPALNCCGGGGLEPKIVEGIKIKEATAKGYAEATDGDSVNLSNPNRTTRRGRVGKQIANTLDTGCQQGVVTQYRIRKLTPRECFRLMGLRDSEIDTIQSAGISNSQQYKLASNSIVVDNLFHIFRTLFSDTKPQENTQLTLF